MEVYNVLIRLEGHFIRGYGDRNRKSEIILIKNSTQAAKEFIKKDQPSIDRLAKVGELIGGFETPYGMELLSSVHWAVHHGSISINDPENIKNYIYKWNTRKKNIFKETHIDKTIQHIKSFIKL